MKVEQTDRDAAHNYLLHREGFAPLAEAFAAHRIAAEQRGREAERAEVVAWIRSADCVPDADNGSDAAVQALRDLYIADAIEAGQHKPA